jgi:hypothetical protein
VFAADNPTPVRFEVEAPCTDAPRFAESVSARTPRIKPTDARNADTVQVRVEGTRGSFVIVGARGGEPSAPRTLEGATCDEVAAALGLAVALVFDPDATDKPAPKAEPSPQAPAPTRFPAAVVAPLPSPPPPPPPRIAVGLQGTVAGANDLPLGAMAFGEILSKRMSARLAFGFQRATVEVAARSADFTWGLLVPDICPLRLVSEPLELTPCLGMALGVVEAEPNEIPGAASFTRAWIAPKPILRARLLLASSFAIEAQLGAEIPLIRGHYTFGGVTAYDVAAVVPSFALGGWYSP